MCRFFTVLLLVSPIAAGACQLCYEAARQMMTVGQQIDAADRVVLAQPLGGGVHFRIIAAIKGNDTGSEVVTDPMTGLDASAPAECDPCLLVHNAVDSQWTVMGTMQAESADWLRQLAATFLIEGDRPLAAWPRGMQPSSVLSDAGWRQRIVLVLPYLDSSDPLVAQIAWGELARAPYANLGVVRSRIDASRIESWLNDPKLVSRYAVCTLLLGFVGDPTDAARLEERIEAAGMSHDATDLAVTIGADLELRGLSRVGWVEAKYFVDRTRTMPEIEAALLALGVHGEANRTIPREAVIRAYRAFIKDRPAMAGFVAEQLADWDYWDAATEYAALLASMP